jgi:hypothetical protein
MAGGTLQLIATGSQDIPLIGSPQITFFKLVYRRHTNFAKECIQQEFNGTADWSRTISCNLSRNADLVQELYLQITLPELRVAASAAITSATRTNATNITVYTAAGHGFVVGDIVTIAGYTAGNTTLNRTDVPITVVTTDTFTVADATDNDLGPITAGATATITTYNGYFGYTPYLGEKIIDSISVSIGGQLIDSQVGEWIHIWNQLTLPDSKRQAYYEAIGHVPALVTPQNLAPVVPVAGNRYYSLGRTLRIPIPFWFCRNPGLALPLIALQYHEVTIQVRLARFEDVIVSRRSDNTTTTIRPFMTDFNDTAITDVNLLVNYVFLDTDERKNFAITPHQYLIEQTYAVGDQPLTANTTTNKINLPLSHPVKFVTWVAQSSSVVAPGYLQWFNYTSQRHFDGMMGPLVANADNYAAVDAIRRGTLTNLLSTAGPGSNLCRNARIQLNSQDRFSTQPGFYFNRIVPLECFSRTPNTGINVYSFSLRPEEHQPTGQCNFSRIDHAYIIVDCGASTDGGTPTYTIRVYSVNYNILRIVSGMGGIMYS